MRKQLERDHPFLALLESAPRPEGDEARVLLHSPLFCRRRSLRSATGTLAIPDRGQLSPRPGAAQTLSTEAHVPTQT